MSCRDEEEHFVQSGCYMDIGWCIVQCQCECSAGTGPYAPCKHVFTVLFCLQMCSECEDIVSEETYSISPNFTPFETLQG